MILPKSKISVRLSLSNLISRKQFLSSEQIFRLLRSGLTQDLYFLRKALINSKRSKTRALKNRCSPYIIMTSAPKPNSRVSYNNIGDPVYVNGLFIRKNPDFHKINYSEIELNKENPR